MIIVSGTFEIEPSDVEEAKRAARQMAQATRLEEGCITYAFFTDIDAPHRFRVFEEWTSDAALKDHFRSPHMAVFRKALGAIRVVSRDVKRYEVGAVESL